MARRDKATLLAEFHRLYDRFEQINAALRPFLDPQLLALDHLITSRAEMLAWVENDKGTLSDCIQGVRQAVNEALHGIEMMVEDNPIRAALVLENYRNATSHDLFSDMDRPSRTARKILRRGHMRNETEFQVLNAVLSDLSSATFSPTERSNAENLLAQYEANPS